MNIWTHFKKTSDTERPASDTPRDDPAFSLRFYLWRLAARQRWLPIEARAWLANVVATALRTPR